MVTAYWMIYVIVIVAVAAFTAGMAVAMCIDVWLVKLSEREAAKPKPKTPPIDVKAWLYRAETGQVPHHHHHGRGSY